MTGCCFCFIVSARGTHLDFSKLNFFFFCEIVHALPVDIFTISAISRTFNLLLYIISKLVPQFPKRLFHLAYLWIWISTLNISDVSVKQYKKKRTDLWQNNSCTLLLVIFWPTTIPSSCLATLFPGLGPVRLFTVPNTEKVLRRLEKALT